MERGRGERPGEKRQGGVLYRIPRLKRDLVLASICWKVLVVSDAQRTKHKKASNGVVRGQASLCGPSPQVG